MSWFDHDIHGLDPDDYEEGWDARFEAGKYTGKKEIGRLKRELFNKHLADAEQNFDVAESRRCSKARENPTWSERVFDAWNKPWFRGCDDLKRDYKDAKATRNQFYSTAPARQKDGRWTEGTLKKPSVYFHGSLTQPALGEDLWEDKKREIFEQNYDTSWHNGILGFNRSGYQKANANQVAREQVAANASWFPFLARTAATGAATVANMFAASKLQPVIHTTNKSAPKPSSSEQQEEEDDSGLFSGMSTSEWVCLAVAIGLCIVCLVAVIYCCLSGGSTPKAAPARDIEDGGIRARSRAGSVDTIVDDLQT